LTEPSTTRRICRSSLAASCFAPKPGIETAGDDRLEERADRPPECALRVGAADALEAGGCRAHLLRAVAVAAQEPEQAVLVQAALLQEMRGELVVRHGQRHAGKRRPQPHVGEEEIGGGSGLDAAQPLHRLVFGKQLQRHRGAAGDELIQENRELAACAIDACAGGLDVRRRHLLDAPELPLDLIRVSDHRVQPDHLERADAW
jgi:hypothetical protein